VHYLCQLCSLFFRWGSQLSKFEPAARHLIRLPPESVIQIIIIPQFDH
jgi:hypothetical protein